MKSNLFSKQDPTRDEAFKKDVQVLLSLGSEVWKKLPEHAVRVRLAPSDRETNAASDEASKALKVPRAKLDHALRLSQYFIGEFRKHGDAYRDEPADLVSDLEKMVDPSIKKKREELTAFLARLKQLTLQKVEPEAHRKAYALSSLPVLKAISTTANYRVVFDDDFKVGKDLKSFKPKCQGVIPIGIIQLNLDEGSAKEVFFQADRRSLRLLIEHLESLEKQLDIARAHFDLEEAPQ